MTKLSDTFSVSDLQTKIVTEDILERSSSRPIYLSSVEVVGGETFSTDFFKKLLSPLVENSDYTLGELITNVNSSYSKLVKTDVFKNIGVSLHSDYASKIPSDVKVYNNEKSIPTKVIFDVQAINLNTGEGFFTFNNDDNLNVNLNYLNNNFNENAELVNFGVNYNPYKPNEHLISNGKFIANLNNPSFKFIIDLFNTNQNNQAWQQNMEKSTGGLIGLQYVNTNKSFALLNGVSLAKRTIYDIGDGASDDLKFFGGDYLKLSFVNQLVLSNLTTLNKITNNFPIFGYKVLLSNEISSNQEHENPNNQSAFLKSNIGLNFFKSFWDNKITTHFFNEAGFIYSTGSSKNENNLSNIHISDRFYLGGFNSFRGFTRNSVNTNGGSQFYKSGLTVFAKLPSFIYSPHKISATNVASLEDGLGYEANPLRLYATGLVGNVAENLLLEKNNGVASAGVGLKYINHWANFDLGYFISRRFGNDLSSSGIKDGFQFEVSIGGSNSSL